MLTSKISRIDRSPRRQVLRPAGNVEAALPAYPLVEYAWKHLEEAVAALGPGSCSRTALDKVRCATVQSRRGYCNTYALFQADCRRCSRLQRHTRARLDGRFHTGVQLCAMPVRTMCCAAVQQRCVDDPSPLSTANWRAAIAHEVLQGGSERQRCRHRGLDGRCTQGDRATLNRSLRLSVPTARHARWRDCPSRAIAPLFQACDGARGMPAPTCHRAPECAGGVDRMCEVRQLLCRLYSRADCTR